MSSSLLYLSLDVDEPEPRTCVSIDEWIDVWGTIVGKAKNMEDLPMWLQYYPRNLFEVINRSGIIIDVNTVNILYVHAQFFIMFSSNVFCNYICIYRDWSNYKE